MKPSRGSMVEEVRRRFPRLTVSMVAAFIFWFISLAVPEIVGDYDLPGVNVKADLFVWVAATLLMVIFLIRAMSDAVVLADIGTDIVVRRLGVKEERSLRRAGREAIYIILAILLAEAARPFLSAVPRIGGPLSALTSLLSFGVVLVLIYDIGRILYRFLEEKAGVVANWLADLTERAAERRRE